MTPITISLELFVPPMNVIPKLTVRTVKHDELKTCTCENLRKRCLAYHKADDPFTMNILCQSEESLQFAFDQYRHCLEHSAESVKDFNIHEYTLSKLVDVCDCYLNGELVLFGENLVSEPASEVDVPLTPKSVENTTVPTELPTNVDDNEEGMKNKVFEEHQILRRSPFALKVAKYTGVERRRKTNCRIREIIKTEQPALENCRKDFGYIYILKSKSKENCVKIGMSTKHPRIRCEGLSRCYKDVKLVAHTNIAIPWPKQVERLVGAELAFQRKYHDCNRCSKTHTEWFEATIELAEQIVLRWAQWIAKEPYHPSDGILRPEWNNRLTDKSMNVLLPAADHILTSDSWQRWTDTRGHKGVDHSSKISIHRLKKDVSPWRKNSGYI